MKILKKVVTYSNYANKSSDQSLLLMNSQFFGDYFNTLRKYCCLMKYLNWHGFNIRSKYIIIIIIKYMPYSP